MTSRPATAFLLLTALAAVPCVSEEVEARVSLDVHPHHPLLTPGREGRV